MFIARGKAEPFGRRRDLIDDIPHEEPERDELDPRLWPKDGDGFGAVRVSTLG